MIYDQLKIKGIDCSEFNGLIDWSKVRGDFCAIRVGYGSRMDARFESNWSGCPIKKIAYWYMDYYSNWYNPNHPANGLPDAEWGKQQAENCFAFMENDKTMVFLDIESGGASYSPPLTNLVAKEHAQIIARAFLTRMDELNGKFNGIYTSVGWLSWFWSWFRNRPLWVAWYNELVSQEDVIYSCQKNGWDGKVLMWQYASDGDVDGNGTSDGLGMGMQFKFLDLNVWVSTDEEYQAFSGIVIQEPDDEVIPVKITKWQITAKPWLTIREQPNTTSKMLGLYYPGSMVNITSIVKNTRTWGKLDGQVGYVCLDYAKQML